MRPKNERPPPVPVKIAEGVYISPLAVEFFNRMDEDDFEFLEAGIEVARWAKTTNRLRKALLVSGIFVFSGMIALAQMWDLLVEKVFGKVP